MPSISAAPSVGEKVTPGSTNSGVAGWVGITNMSNIVLDATEVVKYDKIKIIKDRGADNPLQQVVISLSQLANTSAYSGAIASEQVSYVGYNGTSGTIDNTPNNFFLIKLEHTPNAFLYGKRPASYKYGTYQSGGSATALSNATGLINSLVANFRANRTTDWRVKSELVISDTTVTLGTNVIATMSFTRYSKAVTVVAGSAGGTIATGNYIRIGAASDLTAPVYKVASGVTLTAAATGTLLLETVYQGETATITVGAATGVTKITTTPAANIGIKITGIKQKYDVNRWRQYDKVRFNTFLEGFDTSVVTTTAAFDGVAVYEQVANDEYISWGDEGQVFVDQVPPLFREQDAKIGQQYQPAVISWLDRLPSLIGAGENKGQAIVYFAGGTGTSTYDPAAGSANPLQAAFITTFNLWSNVDLPTTFVYTP